MFQAMQRLKASQLNELGMGDTTYTPELQASTNPNLGDEGQADGFWHRNGLLITAYFRFLFGGSGVSAGNGSYRVTLPFPFDPTVGFATNGMIAGTAFLHDSSDNTNDMPAAVSLFDPEDALVILRPHGFTFMTHSQPFTVAAGDLISGFATYPADPASLP